MSEKKIKARFNIIDVLIIVVLAAVLWVFANYASVTPVEVNKETVQYTVEIKGIREENVGAFTEGDEITGDKGGSVIGKIISVGEYENETAITENVRTGEFVTAEIPNRYTATMSRTPVMAVRTSEKAKNLLALVGKYPFEKKNRHRIATRPNAKKSPIRFIFSLQRSDNTEVQLSLYHTGMIKSISKNYFC